MCDEKLAYMVLLNLGATKLYNLLDKKLGNYYKVQTMELNIDYLICTVYSHCTLLFHWLLSQDSYNYCFYKVSH